MKYSYKLILLLGLFAAALSSCLKSNLPKLNNSSLNGMTAFNYEYRWVDTSFVLPGTPQADTVISVKMAILDNSVTISHDTLYTAPAIPASLPASQRPNVTLKHLWAYASIPNAATVVPLNSAPRLGDPGDFTGPVSYQVTAANGVASTWVVVTAPLQ
jgi:hypothetical protein